MSNLKQRCAKIADSHQFTKIIIALIVVNAVLVGLETYPSIINQYFDWIYIADTLLLWIFTMEIVIRFVGSKSIVSFFKDPWNVFDSIIILSGHLLVGAHYVTILRVLRVLRVLRAVSVIPSLRKMVNALILTIPSMGTIMLLLSIFFYIYAIIGTTLYGSILPEYFGTLHDTILSLFQIITLESWATGVMQPILEESPSAWIYFVTFIVIGAFIIINLFVGVIVNNVEEAARAEQPTPTDLKLEEVQKELREIKKLLTNKTD